MSANPSGLCYGFEAGLGVQVPTSDVSDLLKTTVNFGGGVELGYGALRWKAVVSYGQPSIKVPNPFGVVDDTGRDLQLNKSHNISNVSLALMMGYRMSVGERVSVTPLAGVHYSHLGWSVNDIVWSKNDDGRDVFSVTDSHDVSLGGWSWRVGVDVDIKLHSRFVENKRYTSSVRVSPFVAGLRFKGGLPATTSGCCVGVTVAYSGLFSHVY